MGQGACGGYLKTSSSLIKSNSSAREFNNNSEEMTDAKKIAELEEILKQKTDEINGLQVRILHLSDHEQML